MVLQGLTTRDLCQLRHASKLFLGACNEEIQRRVDRWKDRVSLGWTLYRTVGTSPDEIPFEKARLELDAGFREFAAPTRNGLLETIASWCGGWGPLLQARDTSALVANVSIANNGVQETAAFPNVADSYGRQVLLLDIHCNGMWKWSTIIPVSSQEYNGFDSGEHGSYDLAYIIPMCFDSLGDSTSSGTVYPEWQEYRPKRYLLSTDSKDTRSWRFNLSVVSPRCSETLLVSQEVVPEIVTTESDCCCEKGWIPFSGLGEPDSQQVQVFLRIAEEERLAMQQNLLRTSEKNSFNFLGIHEGRFFTYEAYTELSFFLDKEEKHKGRSNREGVEEEEKEAPRFHVLFDFCCQSDLLNHMIVRPPPPRRRQN